LHSPEKLVKKSCNRISSSRAADLGQRAFLSDQQGAGAAGSMAAGQGLLASVTAHALGHSLAEASCMIRT